MTINPGTTVKFVYGFDKMQSGLGPTRSEILVYGTLDANGESGNLIVFESSRHGVVASKTDWNGIYAGVGSDVAMDFCIVRDSDYGIYGYKPATLVVENCLFDCIKTTGIFMTLDSQSSSPQIRSSRLHDCGIYGIRCVSQSFIAQKDSVEDCLYGISYTGDSSPVIEDCTVVFSQGEINNSYYGIYASKATGQASPTISGCYIEGFRQGGIYFNGISNAGLIAGSTVFQSGIYGIYLTLSSPSLKSDIPLKNFVKSNDYGLYVTNSSSPTVRRTKFENAKIDGVFINFGCSSTDLGTEDDPGDNSFIKNDPMGPSYKHLYNVNLLSVSAIYNYWQPLNGSLIVNALYEPYRASDPLPKVRPAWDMVGLAEDFELAGAYPNPFNSATTISFNLTSPRFVTVKIYNIMGQEVKTIFEGYGSSGENTVVWNGDNRRGSPVSTGVYLVQLKSRDNQKTIKTTFLR